MHKMCANKLLLLRRRRRAVPPPANTQNRSFEPSDRDPQRWQCWRRRRGEAVATGSGGRRIEFNWSARACASHCVEAAAAAAAAGTRIDVLGVDTAAANLVWLETGGGRRSKPRMMATIICHHFAIMVSSICVLC